MVVIVQVPGSASKIGLLWTVLVCRIPTQPHSRESFVYGDTDSPFGRLPDYKGTHVVGLFILRVE